NAAAFDGDYRIHPADGSGDKASWTFTGLPAGSYDVQVTWPPHDSRGAAVTYTLTFRATTTAGTGNQAGAPPGGVFARRRWQSLRVADVSGGTLRVEVTASAGGTVAADAVRLVRVGGEPPALATLDLTGNPLNNLSRDQLVGQLEARGVTVTASANQAAPD